MKSVFLTVLAGSLLVVTGVRAQTPAPAPSRDSEMNQIWQYFAASTIPKASANSGAYLWIPPNTPQIRAVMVGIQNGLPICILQHAAVRAVCRQYGIAQILMTPNGSEIGPVMLKGLSFDITDPERTAVYDLYLKTLSDLSGHPELVTAPIVPLAHSAYCSFPFEAAARDPDHCLASIPIKAGLPDLYKMYGPGGGSKSPKPDVNLRSIPILFVSSQSQETVGWSAYPRGPGAPSNYRKDHPDHPGDTYEPGNELFGVSHSMMCGHFDMLPRDYEYVADWLGAVAKLRLPDKPGDPLKPVFLKDGWLMQPAVPTTGPVPADYPQPAPYADFKGTRSKALWYPTEELARRQFEIARDEPRKKVEIFTLLDPKGQPISLAHGHMATMPDSTELLTGEGEIVLTTYHYNKPPEICTVKDKNHPKDAAIPCQLSNVAFPGQDTLPVSGLPLHFDMNSSPFELLSTEPFTDERGVSGTRLKLKIRYNRLVGEQIYTVNRIYEDGNQEYAPSGRSVLITWWLGGLKDFGGKPLEGQKITFEPMADVPVGTDSVPLKAKASSGLNVDYFVSYGPGVIKDGAFIPTEVPVGATKPITVTIGAYHPGMYSGEKLYKAASVVYQTFHLTP